MVLFLIGLVLFLGIHSVAIVAPAWRDAQAARNPGAWKGIYSVISIAGFVLLIYGYGLALPFLITAALMAALAAWTLWRVSPSAPAESASPAQ
jgi:uncharacterized membrane protein